MNMTFHLLIVDDNPADISLAREGLAAAAYSGKIESVGDGLEALAFLNRKGNFADATKPDLVILDPKSAEAGWPLRIGRDESGA